LGAAEKYLALSSGPPVFCNLDVLEDRGIGPNPG
jgi:hypothetical protein